MAEMTLRGLLGATDGITNSFITSVYPAIAEAVGPPIYFLAILYWVLLGYKVYAGHSALHWNEISTRVFTTVAVFATLNWSGFAKLIYQSFVSLMESTAATIMAGKPTAQMLDALYANISQVADTLRSSDFYQMAMILDGFLLFVLNCLLFILALCYMSIAKFGLAITMILAPLFIAFVFFSQSRQWFFNWLSMMLNFCFIYILVIAVVRFGFLAFGTAIESAGEGMANTEQTTQLFIIEGVLIIFMLQVKTWAAALSGGISVQGISLLMNTGKSLKFRGST